MISIPSSLSDMKGQVAMSLTLGMVLDDSQMDNNGGMMGASALLGGGDEGADECGCVFCVVMCH